MSQRIIFIVFIVLSTSLIIDGADPCRYEDPNKGVIDLSSLARSDGRAAYPDKIPSTGSNYKYSYNPCKPFSQGTACLGVAACQVTMDGAYSFSIGKQESAVWSSGTGVGSTPTVTYTDGPKTTIVSLICVKDGTDDLEALGEPTTNNYKFRLTNKCACWDGCRSSPTTSSSSSTATTSPIPYQNCSINGSVYSSDKEAIQSFPFHISINPSETSTYVSSYALVNNFGSVIELHLVNIDTIPSSLFCLEHLQVLSIVNSSDVSVSADFLQLADTLKSFTLVNISKPIALPSTFYKMTLLSTLSLINVGLTTILEDIANLYRLEHLSFDQNKLTSLPAALGRMPSLTSLSISNNSNLSSIDVLSGSGSLVTLRASNCYILHLPYNIPTLTTIEMNNNQLSSLDGLETISSDSSQSLSFSFNSIASISTQSLSKIQTLQYLDLSENFLEILPDPLYRIQGLQTLNVHNNNFDGKEKEWIEGLFRQTDTTVIL